MLLSTTPNNSLKMCEVSAYFYQSIVTILNYYEVISYVCKVLKVVDNLLQLLRGCIVIDLILKSRPSTLTFIFV